MAKKERKRNLHIGPTLYGVLALASIWGYSAYLSSTERSLRGNFSLQQKAHDASLINLKLFQHYQPDFSELKKRLSTSTSLASSEQLLSTLKQSQAIASINHLDFRLTAAPRQHLFPKVKTVQHMVRLKFNACREEEVFLFLTTLQTTLPGYVISEKIHLNRLKPLTPAMLIDIREGKKPDLISGEYNFQWIVPLHQKDSL